MIVPRCSSTLAAKDFCVFIRSLAARPEAVRDFEKAVAARMNRRHAVATPGCGAALFFLLANLPQERAVVFPALGNAEHAAAARQAGFSLRFADVHPERLVVDESALAKIPADGACAVVVSYPFGRAPDMNAIGKIAWEKNWIVVEDVTAGLGASWRTRPAGSFGDAAVMDFDARLNLSTFGGGMILTDDGDLAVKTRASVASVSRPSDLSSLFRGLNGFAQRIAYAPIPFAFGSFPHRQARALRGDVPDDLNADAPGVNRAADAKSFFHGGLGAAQAHFGLSQLRKLDFFCMKRRLNGRRLQTTLEEAEGVRYAPEADGEEPGYGAFPIFVDDPEGFSRRLLAAGVDATRDGIDWLPESDPNAFPNARRAWEHLLVLPAHIHIDARALAHVARAVRISAK